MSFAFFAIRARQVRSGSGDGLGPMFSARSCAACHHQQLSSGRGTNMHDGEGAASAAHFRKLSAQERQDLVAFVHSLGAP